MTPHRCYECGGLLRPAAFDQAMCTCPKRRSRVADRFVEEKKETVPASVAASMASENWSRYEGANRRETGPRVRR